MARLVDLEVGRCEADRIAQRAEAADAFSLLHDEGGGGGVRRKARPTVRRRQTVVWGEGADMEPLARTFAEASQTLRTPEASVISSGLDVSSGAAAFPMLEEAQPASDALGPAADVPLVTVGDGDPQKARRPQPPGRKFGQPADPSAARRTSFL
jgi:hypothetical protein